MRQESILRLYPNMMQATGIGLLMSPPIASTWNFSLLEKEAVKQLLAPMKIRLEEIEATDLRQSIGDLAEEKKNVLTAPFTGSAPQESLMVFCGVNEKHFDKILFELRRKQIPVDYKAVLTPSNRKWSVLMLMLELTKEKNSFRQGN